MNTTALPKVGAVLAERYLLEEVLGEGAMGLVFRARDQRLDRAVALKVLKPDTIDPTGLQRFKREFRAAARLDHPHCTRSFELYDREVDAPFLTMEYVGGGSLDLEHRHPPGVVVGLGLQLLAGLDYIHAKEIIHRDLKPRNILVEAAEHGLHLRLADFGIAKVADFTDEHSQVGTVMGSARYLAPETFDHGSVDPRSDLYALGIILYTMFAGQHPFGDGVHSVREWISLHRRGQMQPLAELCPDLPASLTRIIHRMSHPRPEERFSDAGSTYDALHAELEHFPEVRRPRHPALLRSAYLATPTFVGRSAETATILELHRRTQHDNTSGSCAVLITGRAGQGKTRLLRELLINIVDHPTLVFVGTCRAEGGTPYEALQGLRDELLRTSVAHSRPERATEASEVELARLERATAPPDLRPLRPPIIPPASCSPDAPTASLTPTSVTPSYVRVPPAPAAGRGADELSSHIQTHARWIALLRILARRQPVFIVLEDAQWADPPTLQFLTSLARTIATGRQAGQSWPVGLVLSYRPAPVNAELDVLRQMLIEHEMVDCIDLGPLSSDDADELAASMLMVPPGQLPAGMTEHVVARAEGSPLLLSQMLHSVLARGSLRRDSDGRWQLKTDDLAAAALPRQVDAAIGDRAARFGPGTKHVLATASVLGRHFDVPALQAVTQYDELPLLDTLDELVRGRFIEDTPGGYRFVHDRIRETIYDALPPTESRRLHLAAARDLRARGGERPERWPVLAHHYVRAGDHAQAHAFALMAADHALGTYAYGAAVEHYTAALESAAAGDIAVDSVVHERLADACTAVGRYPLAKTHYRLRLADRLSDDERIVALSKSATLEHRRGRLVESIEPLEQVLAMTGITPPQSTVGTWVGLAKPVLQMVLPGRGRSDERASPRGEIQTRTIRLLTECYLFSQHSLRRLYYMLLAATTVRRQGLAPPSIPCEGMKAVMLTALGMHERGAKVMRDARAKSEQLDVSPSDLCMLEAQQSLIYMTTGRFDLARRVLGEAAHRYRNSTSVEARRLMITPRCMCLLFGGYDFDLVERLCRELYPLVEETNDDRGRLEYWLILGMLRVAQDRTSEALAALREAHRLGRVSDQTVFQAVAADLLAQVLVLEGELGAAIEYGLDAARVALDYQPLGPFPTDGGVVLAAALARKRGEPLRAEVVDAVGAVLRRRRRLARSSAVAALRFDVAEAAWRSANGRVAAFDRAMAMPSRRYCALELRQSRRIAALFDSRGAERHRRIAERMQLGFDSA